MSSLRGKVALVTGGTSGIGKAIAERFVQEGALVVISGRSHQRGRAVAEELNGSDGSATFIPADVTQEREVRTLVDKSLRQATRLDILVNSAGVILRAPLVETPEEAWDRVMAVNVKGVFLCTKHVLPIMMKQRSGAIVNVASLAGKIVAPDLSAYCASKGAVIQLTRATALEGAPYNVRANALCPTLIGGTPIADQFLMAHESSEQARLDFVKSIPLKRLGTVSDVAYAALFFSTDESSFLTGIALPVDGGVYLE